MGSINFPPNFIHIVSAIINLKGIVYHLEPSGDIPRCNQCYFQEIPFQCLKARAHTNDSCIKSNMHWVRNGFSESLVESNITIDYLKLESLICSDMCPYSFNCDKESPLCLMNIIKSCKINND